MNHSENEDADSVSDSERFITKLRKVIDNTTGSIGNEYFRRLAEQLATAFDVEYVSIAESVTNSTRMRTIAYHVRDHIAPNIEYDSLDTPCGEVHKNEITFYPSDLQKHFPKDTFLQDIQAESYLAMPFNASDGHTLGHICLIGCRPMDRNLYDEYLLKIICARLSAECLRMQAEQQLIHNATHDPLTSLPNKTLFWDRIRTAIARSQRSQQHFGLMFIDLDNFKQMNDTYGHHYGDQFLIALSMRLKKSCRQSDTLCRFGGDEFVIIMEDIRQLDDIANMAGYLHHRMVDDSYEVDNLKINAEVSIGVAIYPEHGSDSESLLQHADEAMYAAKRAHNRYRIYCDPNEASH